MVDTRNLPLPEPSVERDAATPPRDADAVASQLRAAVARAVRRVCPRWLADDAEDLTQIATTRVLARMSQASSANVTFTPGYLYRAVHSALVDEIRRRRRLREEPIDESVGAVRRAGSPSGEVWEIPRRDCCVPGGARGSEAAGGDAPSPRPLGGGDGRAARLQPEDRREPHLPRPGEPARLPRRTGGRAMNADRGDSNRLAARLREAGTDARPREDCPSAEEIWSALHLEVPAADRMRIIDHTAECPVCAEAWRLAMEIEKADSTGIAASPALAPWRRQPAAWAGLAAAVAIIAFGTVLALRWRTPSPDPVDRDQAANTIRSLIGESASLPRDAFRLQWSSGPAGSRYDVIVTTSGLDEVANVRAIEPSELTIEPARLAALSPGTRLLWRVVAHTPDGRTIASPTYVAIVQ